MTAEKHQQGLNHVYLTLIHDYLSLTCLSNINKSDVLNSLNTSIASTSILKLKITGYFQLLIRKMYIKI